jgi:hypothetical protein
MLSGSCAEKASKLATVVTAPRLPSPGATPGEAPAATRASASAAPGSRRVGTSSSHAMGTARMRTSEGMHRDHLSRVRCMWTSAKVTAEPWVLRAMRRTGEAAPPRRLASEGLESAPASISEPALVRRSSSSCAASTQIPPISLRSLQIRHSSSHRAGPVLHRSEAARGRRRGKHEKPVESAHEPEHDPRFVVRHAFGRYYDLDVSWLRFEFPD